MTTLADIRDIETRLHSHFLEWSDTPLQNELLYMLDDLQELHGQLDRMDVPKVGQDGLELNLCQRVKQLASTCHMNAMARERPHDFYGQSFELECQQLPLPISPRRKE